MESIILSSVLEQGNKQWENHFQIWENINNSVLEAIQSKATEL